jgi:hypothetical protein
MSAELHKAINSTFVTPLDRSDTYALAVALQEVPNAIFATELRFVVHAMEDLPWGKRELAELIVRTCRRSKLPWRPCGR